MNLNRSVLVAVMVMASALGSGCKAIAALQGGEPAAPPETTDDAKVTVQGDVTVGPAHRASLERGEARL
jgi:hypothetical protein